MIGYNAGNTEQNRDRVTKERRFFLSGVKLKTFQFKDKSRKDSFFVRSQTLDLHQNSIKETMEGNGARLQLLISTGSGNFKIPTPVENSLKTCYESKNGSRNPLYHLPWKEPNRPTQITDN